jgi:hypothetical protein
MNRNTVIFALLIIVVLAGITVSGCLSNNDSNQSQAVQNGTNTSDMYASWITIPNGTVVMMTSMPVENYPDGDGMPLDKLPSDTWIFAIWENQKADYVKAVANVSSLSDLNIYMKMPSGKVMYARNFTMSKAQDGIWHIEAEHAGFQTVAIYSNQSEFDGKKYPGMPYSFDWDNESLVSKSKLPADGRIIILLIGEQQR